MLDLQLLSGIRCLRRSVYAIAIAVFAIIFFGTTSRVRADYRINVGDVIEISASRIPELQRRVVVQSDGSISFPMLGTLLVAGSTEAEMQAKIQAILSAKVFRQRTTDGREIATVIAPDELSAAIVEYRPIYVNGDVSRPGEHPYRPLMTVRQAVALSGGYDAMRGKSNGPLLDPADLTSDNEAMWIDLVKVRTQVWRIKTELGDKDTIDRATLMDVPVMRSTLNEIIRVETEQLKTRQDNFLHEKTFLLRSIKQVGEQIAVLTEQQQKEDQGTQADADELQRVNDLFSKGSVPITRVTDARRAVLLSATRKLQTTAQLMQERKQQDDFVRQLERLDDQRRVDLLRELQDATVRLGEIRAKLQGIEMKIQMSGVARTGHDAGVKPAISIHRIGENGWEGFVADEDAQLQPGDVIEVALRLPRAPGSPEATIEFSAPSPQSGPVASYAGTAAEDNVGAKERASRSSLPMMEDTGRHQSVAEPIHVARGLAAEEPDDRTTRSATHSADATGPSGASPAAPSASVPSVASATSILEAAGPRGDAPATPNGSIPTGTPATITIEATRLGGVAAATPTVSIGASGAHTPQTSGLSSAALAAPIITGVPPVTKTPEPATQSGPTSTTPFAAILRAISAQSAQVLAIRAGEKPTAILPKVTASAGRAQPVRRRHRPLPLTQPLNLLP